MAAGRRKTKLAYTLMLVGGIIILLFGLFLAAIAAGFSSASAVSSLPSSLSIVRGAVVIAGSISAAIGIITGAIIIAMATMLEDNQHAKVRKLSTIALAASIISFLGGGGFIIGFILALVGSAMGMRYKK